MLKALLHCLLFSDLESLMYSVWIKLVGSEDELRGCREGHTNIDKLFMFLTLSHAKMIPGVITES